MPRRRRASSASIRAPSSRRPRSKPVGAPRSPPMAAAPATTTLASRRAKAGRARASSSSTTEFVDGAERGEQAQFRAYGSVAENVADYVRVLREPRYAAALGTGSDVRAFADALQRGGYATDPRVRQQARRNCRKAALERLPVAARCEAVQVGRRHADTGLEDEQWLTCSGQVCPVCARLQRALDTTAHNIANVSTEGYTRQRVDFATRTAAGLWIQLDRQRRRRRAGTARLRPVPV